MTSSIALRVVLVSILTVLAARNQRGTVGHRLDDAGVDAMVIENHDAEAPTDAGGIDMSCDAGGIDMSHDADVVDMSRECMSGTHDCGGVCVSRSSVLSCGASCAECPSDPNGSATCDGTSCGVDCNVGTRMCGGSCTVCPSSGVTTTTCGTGASCVAATCSPTHVLIAGTCVLNPVISLQAYVKASNTSPSDRFGSALALSGDGNTLVVGSTGEASDATGIGGNQTSNSANAAGAVYVYQQAYIKASNAVAADEFGYGVALSADGSALVVGAAARGSRAGTVYVFARTDGVWWQRRQLMASSADADDSFGNAVSISADGNTIVAGAFLEDSQATGIDGDSSLNAFTDSGAAYVFAQP